jgi:hypothetical protein
VTTSITRDPAPGLAGRLGELLFPRLYPTPPEGEACIVLEPEAEL